MEPMAHMARIPKVLLLIDSSSEFGRGLFRGITRYSDLHGPWAVYRPPPVYWEGVRRPADVSWLKPWRADGIIMRGRRDVVAQLIEQGVPTIAASYKGERIEGVPNVMTDDVSIGRLGAEHLLNCGLRHFAFCGFADMDWSRRREEGFREKVAARGCEIGFYRQPYARALRQWHRQPEQMAQWFETLPKPLGLMACNDEFGLPALEACKFASLHVPEDVAVLGVGNDEFVCRLSQPRMSSVVIDAEKAGFEAACVLERLMGGDRDVEMVIEAASPFIAARQSTDVVLVDDPTVGAALRYIRGHAMRAIQIEDVASEIAVSRRTLERSFQRVLGRSILREIRRVRTEQICRLLIDTDLTVVQIARRLDFASAEHIYRYFRQGTGTTLLAYRRKHRVTPAQGN